MSHRFEDRDVDVTDSDTGRRLVEEDVEIEYVFGVKMDVGRGKSCVGAGGGIEYMPHRAWGGSQSDAE
ncbi:hypothetical protein DSL72_007568 [Monilinia vaccinii-corymbosi]|uniref:Uncharacterized protein n=1 Tax=Monilinia vaccinii-corymbosi TaxID=61207 RepID=A0A8A3PI54_9HELO|nr:hypothetical protein DSL72_007568 [Monilinia vaccinii-corymbosi]